MALKNLSTEGMISLSGAWIDPARDRGKLEKLPLIRLLLPLIDSVHGELLTLRQPADGGESELRRKLEESDRRHDRKVRGVYGLLTALAELAESVEESEELLALRDRVVPLGLRTVQLAYRDEAGNAEAVRASLTPKDRQVLRKLKTQGARTLEDEVDAYLQAGSQLARLEAERAESERRPIAPADILRARNNWIKAIRAVQANLDLDTTADATLRAQLLGPLEDAETRADRRRSKAPGEPADDPGTDPSSDKGPTPPAPPAPPVRPS